MNQPEGRDEGGGGGGRTVPGKMIDPTDELLVLTETCPAHRALRLHPLTGGDHLLSLNCFLSN